MVSEQATLSGPGRDGQQASSFEAKYNKLKKRAARHKKNNRLQNHQFVWLQEAGRLRRQGQAMESDVARVLEDVKAGGQQDEEMQGVLAERQYARGANRRFWMHMQDDITQLKQMWELGKGMLALGGLPANRRRGLLFQEEGQPRQQQPSEMYNAVAMQLDAVKAQMGETKTSLDEENEQAVEASRYITQQWLDSFVEEDEKESGLERRLGSRRSSRRSSLALLDHLEAAKELDLQITTVQSAHGDAPFADSTTHGSSSLSSSPSRPHSSPAAAAAAAAPSSSSVFLTSPSAHRQQQQQSFSPEQSTALMLMPFSDETGSSVAASTSHALIPMEGEVSSAYSDFWEHKMDALEEIDKVHNATLQELRRDYDNFKARQAEGNKGLAPWTKSEHERFKHIFDGYANKPRALYMDRLRLEFGHARGMKELRQKDVVLQKAKYVREKRRNVNADWKRQRDTFLDQLEVEVVQVQARERRKQEVEQARVTLDAKRTRLRQELEVLGADKERRRADLEREQCERDAQEQKEAARRMRMEHARRVVEGGRLEEYREQQEAEAARKARARQGQQARLAELKAQLLPLHRERVEFREERGKEKQLLRLVARERKEIDAIEKQRRLDQLAKTVSDTIHVPVDPERVFRHTESTNPDNWHPSQRPGAKSQGGMHSSSGYGYGYSDDKLMADPRFRLQFELRQRGLHQSAYGRQLVQDLAPAPRPDMQSSVFRNM
jgi:hypothetical protein